MPAAPFAVCYIDDIPKPDKLPGDDAKGSAPPPSSPSLAKIGKGLLAGGLVGGAINAGVGRQAIQRNKDWLQPAAQTAGRIGGMVGGSLIPGAGGLVGGAVGSEVGEHAADAALGFSNQSGGAMDAGAFISWLKGAGQPSVPPPGHAQWLANFEQALHSDPKLAALALKLASPPAMTQNANEDQESAPLEQNASAGTVAHRAGTEIGGVAGGAGGYLAGRELGRAAFTSKAGKAVGGFAGGVVGGLVGHRVARNLAHQGIQKVRDRV